jgi:hypothetical protein
MLRQGNVHSADRWKELLESIVRRYEDKGIRKYFRGDAAFAKPEIYEYLEENGLLYAVRLPANDVLYDEIKHLLNCPVGRPSRKPIIKFHDFVYQAASWQKKRRVVAKVEWHQEDLFQRVGFIETNMSAKAVNVKENGDILISKWLENCFISQTRRLRLDYKATESWLFSVTKLIWGIFISVQMRT